MTYVKIINTRSRTTARLSLPVAIGSSRLCDVIVNSTALPAVSLVLDAGEDGQLAITDARRGTLAGDDRLAALGLTVIGPLAGQPDAGSKRQDLAETLLAERGRFARLPGGVRTLLGGFLPQKVRLGAWLAVPVVGIIALASLTREAPVVVEDLSAKKNALTPGGIVAGSVGAVPGYPAFRKGFTFAFTPNEALPAGSEGVLYFDVKDADEKGELEVYVNERKLWTSTALPECVNTFCRTIIAVPAGLIVAGENVIRAQHQPEGSSYLLKNILLTAAAVPTPERKAQISMVYQRAKRAYDERAIVLQNLVTAREELDRLDKLLIGAKESDGVRSDAALLRKATEDGIEKTTDELTFTAEKAVQLGKHDQAEKQYKELLSLYPEADDKIRLAIQKRLREIKEMAQ